RKNRQRKSRQRKRRRRSQPKRQPRKRAPRRKSTAKEKKLPIMFLIFENKSRDHSRLFQVTNCLNRRSALRTALLCAFVVPTIPDATLGLRIRYSHFGLALAVTSKA